MGELLFNCPHCGTELSCDEQSGGQQLQCPTCQGLLISPDAPAVPPSAHRPGGPGKKKKKRKKKSLNTGKVVKIAVLVVVLCVAGYFGFSYLISLQGEVNEKRRKVEKDSDGGQVGHIADLYEVLEATDPNNGSMFMGTEGFEGDPGGGYGETGMSWDSGGDFQQQQAAKLAEIRNLPVIAPVWTLDVAATPVPEGRANGSVGGTNFVAEAAVVMPSGQSQVLSLRQGSGVSPDREILVYLKAASPNELGGQSWTVSSDQQGREVPQILKRWKPNPKYAPKKQAYHGGHVMK